MNNRILALAAFLGAVAIIFGALGAHWLQSQLPAQQLASFNTAVRYQAWHALALLFLAAHQKQLPASRVVAWLWGLGTLLFSGSIYLLSTRVLSGIEANWLGPITPVGGLFLIAGWITLLILALKNN